jgi:hypothetical protein
MRMPEPKGKELIGSWKNYALTFTIWNLRMIKSRIRWVGHAAHIINNRNANWKERPPQRVECRWKDNIKTDLNIGWEGVNWMY